MKPSRNDFKSDQNTRRAFISTSLKAATLVTLSPLATVGENANAACAFAYGSGLYGGACYVGSVPSLLQLPVVQTNIQQNGFRFFLQGIPNGSYEVQYSSDLTNWTTIGTLTMPVDGSPLEILDGQTSDATRRFYRANPL